MLPPAPSHRILIVTDAWKPQVNGVVRTLATVVEELRAMGHAVEVIGPDGFAWLCGPLFLHEALKISEYFEPDARPGKEPHIYVPPASERPRADG